MKKKREGKKIKRDLAGPAQTIATLRLDRMPLSSRGFYQYTIIKVDNYIQAIKKVEFLHVPCGSELFCPASQFHQIWLQWCKTAGVESQKYLQV